ADHVRVQDALDLLRCRHAIAGLHEGILVLLANDIHAQLDALITDEYGRSGDELAHLVLALPAERAVEGVLFLWGHPLDLTLPSRPSPAQDAPHGRLSRPEC